MGRHRLGALAAGIALLVACSAASPTPARFDLVCQGRLTGGRGGDITGPLHIRIDLAAGRFCLDDLCAAFSRSDAARLEFHCVTVRGGSFCKPPTSSAGPYVTHEDLVIERTGWTVSEASSGTAGDPASAPFNTRYTGRCAPAPFTGLAGTAS